MRQSMLGFFLVSLSLRCLGSSIQPGGASCRFFSAIIRDLRVSGFWACNPLRISRFLPIKNPMIIMRGHRGFCVELWRVAYLGTRILQEQQSSKGQKRNDSMGGCDLLDRVM